jgi:hypothetical protein
VLEAGKVLTKLDLDKAVAAYGSDNIGIVPVPVGGVIVVVDPLQVPGLKKGDILDQARLNDLIKTYGDKAFVAQKVEPAFEVGPTGIVPRKPEVVASPTKP